MTSEFASLVSPIFLAVLKLEERMRRGEQVDLEFERNRIRNELAEAEQTARSESCPVTEDDFLLAKRGLIYWIDEVLVRAYPRWQNVTLEFDAFREQNGAVRFYEYAEKEVRHAHPDVIELWFLAMALGFEGDIESAYRDFLRKDPPAEGEEKARTQLAADFYRQIRRNKPGSLDAADPPRDARPLRGGVLLRTAIQLLSLVVAIGVGILVWHRWIRG